MEFKTLIDTLSSLAALVAIVSVMVGWYRSARKALKIKRVVVHVEENERTFIVVVKNRKSYPVIIKKFECYRRKKYEVQRKLKSKIEHLEFFPGSELLFSSSEQFEILPNGLTNIKIGGATNLDIPSKLRFLAETSHGYHELRCGDVAFVNIGKVDVYSVHYRKSFKKKYHAKFFFYWKYLTRR